MRLLALLLAFCLACALSASCGRTEVYDAVRVDEARGADAHLGRDAGVVDAREEDGSLSRQDAGQGFDATASMQDAASSEQDASEAAPDASAADTGPTTPTVIAFEAWPAPSAPVFITNEELTFRVSYSEPVIVEGEPSIPFLLEGSSRQATYVEGTTTPHLLFRYTIQPGDLDAQGLVIGSAIEVPAGASITGASDLADLSLPPFALTLFVNASLACPAQYAFVTGAPESAGEDFCLARFEMRSATSGGFICGPEGGPAIVTKAEALAGCSALGAGYALATNDEWQAVARDVEQRADNWSDRSQASGHLNVGNYSYEAGGSLGEDRPCATEGFTERFRRCTDPTSSHFVRKRTHTLSNGAVLWDLAGNVSEWVQGSAPLAPRDFACALRNQDKRTFGPEGDYSSYCPSPNPDGRNLGFVDGSGGTNIFRGSSSGMEGGVAEPMIGLLYANTHLAWSTGQAGPGFRCAFHGPQLRAIAVIQPSRVTVRRFGNQVFRVRGAAATLSLAENSSSATFDPSSGRYLAGRKGGGRDVIRATLSSGQTLDAWVDVAP